MNKKKRTIVWIVILIIILAGAGGAGSIYYYFFVKQLQLTKTTYIYIDRDDNLDSVYHKIIRNGHPKSMFGFQSVSYTHLDVYKRQAPYYFLLPSKHYFLCMSFWGSLSTRTPKRHILLTIRYLHIIRDG